MYSIEMWEENGSWSVSRWGNKKHALAKLHHTDYVWKPGMGRWIQVGGSFATRDEAEEKIAQYVLGGSWKKPKEFRVV